MSSYQWEGTQYRGASQHSEDLLLPGSSSAPRLAWQNDAMREDGTDSGTKHMASLAANTQPQSAPLHHQASQSPHTAGSYEQPQVTQPAARDAAPYLLQSTIEEIEAFGIPVWTTGPLADDRPQLPDEYLTILRLRGYSEQMGGLIRVPDKGNYDARWITAITLQQLIDRRIAVPFHQATYAGLEATEPANRYQAHFPGREVGQEIHKINGGQQDLSGEMEVPHSTYDNKDSTRKDDAPAYHAPDLSGHAFNVSPPQPPPAAIATGHEQVPFTAQAQNKEPTHVPQAAEAGDGPQLPATATGQPPVSDKSTS